MPMAQLTPAGVRASERSRDMIEAMLARQMQQPAQINNPLEGLIHAGGTIATALLARRAGDKVDTAKASQSQALVDALSKARAAGRGEPPPGSPTPLSFAPQEPGQEMPQMPAAGGGQDAMINALMRDPNTADFGQQMMMRQFEGQFADPPKPIEIEGKLVDPSSGRVIGDYSKPPSAKDRFQVIGNDLVDLETGKPAYRAPFAPQQPREARETWSGPEQLPGMPGLYQRSSFGQIRQVASPQSPGQLVAVRDPSTGQSVLMPTNEAAGMSPADQREGGSFKQERELRGDFDKLTADAREVVNSYGKIESAFKQKTGPGDIAGIFGFMKTIDPTSVVREGEFATAQNTAGVPERIRSMYNQVLGGERLGDTQRGEILAAAGSQITPYRQMYGTVEQQYRTLAEQAGLAPDRVITPLNWPNQSPTHAGAPETSFPMSPEGLANSVKLPQPGQTPSPTRRGEWGLR